VVYIQVNSNRTH